MKKSRIKHNDKYTLGKFLLSFQRYTIPSFQRKYSWRPKNVTEFWNSIINNEPNYYIGTIVAIQNISKDGSETLEIVDGQQRMTTLSLFVLALRNFIKEKIVSDGKKSKISNADSVIDFFNNFLMYKNLLKENSVPELRLKFSKQGLNDVYEGLVTSDNRFCGAIKSRKLFLELNDTQQVFIKNYAKSFDLIKDYIKTKDEIELNILIQNIADNLQNVEFIAIITESDTDTYQLFEGLNSTSSPLTVVDLTKNAILKELNRKTYGDNKIISNAEKIWEELEEEFDVINIKWLDKFLRHQWISENGYINTSELFEKIKKIKLSGNHKTIIEYLNNLLNDARYYIALRTYNDRTLGSRFNDDDPKTNIKRYRKDILDNLRLLNILKLDQIYEIVLSLYRVFESNINYTSKQFSGDIERLWIFSFITRFLSISPSRYEKIFAEYSKKFNSYKKKNYNELSQFLFRELRELLKKSSKTEFVDSFKEIAVFEEDTGQKEILRYILHTFYGIKHSSDGKHYLKKPSIDHIYPKNKKTWGTYDLSEHINKIGNLALLDSDDNGSLNDKLPVLKKKIYKDDPFEYNSSLTSKLSSFQDDPVNTIESRTEDIAATIYDFLIKKV